MNRYFLLSYVHKNRADAPERTSRARAFVLDSAHTMPAHFENGEKCDG